jgi:NADH:ubiquinone oxidoreductase subunit 6 (subunit J)
VFGVLWGAVLSMSGGAQREPVAGVTVRELGTQLMGQHAGALLIIGVLLTVALLGAIVIAATDRPERRTEKP